jgi:hypothetical protein
MKIKRFNGSGPRLASFRAARRVSLIAAEAFLIHLLLHKHWRWACDHQPLR